MKTNKKRNFDLSGLTVAKENYWQAAKAYFFSEWKKKKALKPWKKAYDEIKKDFYESFGNCLILNDFLPPSKSKVDEYKKQLLLLAKTKEEKKICEDLPIFAKDKLNLDRLENVFANVTDVKECKKIFDEEWVKLFHGDINTLKAVLILVPPSRRSEVVKEIIAITESLEDFKGIFELKKFFTPEERSVILEKRLKIGEEFINSNIDPVILANSSSLLVDYQKEIAIFKASMIIAKEKNDEKVRVWLNEIKMPGELKENAYRRFFLTARNQEEGLRIEKTLSFKLVNVFIRSSQIGHFYEERAKKAKKVWTAIGIKKLLKTKTAKKAIAVLEISVPDLVENEKAFEHLLFLIVGYRSGAMIFDMIADKYGQNSFEARLILEQWAPFLKKEILENKSLDLKKLWEKSPKNGNTIERLLIEEALKVMWKKNQGRKKLKR